MRNNVYRSTFGLAFIMYCALAHGQLSSENEEKVRILYKNTVGSWPSPATDASGCFKDICLGQKLSLGSNEFGYYSPNENITSASRGDYKNERVYLCKHTYLGPVLECNVNRSYTAFEKPVGVEISLIVDDLPTSIEKAPPRFNSEKWESTGRVIGITLTSSRANLRVFEDATAYFEKLFLSPGIASKKVTDPQDGYSEKCSNLARSLQAKRPVDITVGERNQIAKCDSDATIAFLEGKFGSSLVQSREWDMKERNFKVKVSSTNMSNMFAGYAFRAQRRKCPNRIPLYRRCF